MGWTIRGSSEGSGKRCFFFCFSKLPDRLWGPPSLLFDVYRFLAGIKAVEAWSWLLTSTYCRRE